jgi:hypothetical protein
MESAAAFRFLLNHRTCGAICACTFDMIAALRREAADRAKRDDAARAVERWNKAARIVGDHHMSRPTVMAIVAGMPWADVHCPACRTSRAIDLRTIDRHPLASMGSLVLGLRCTWCSGAAPVPKMNRFRLLRTCLPSISSVSVSPYLSLLSRLSISTAFRSVSSISQS